MCPQHLPNGSCDLAVNPPCEGDRVDTGKCYHKKFKNRDK